MPKFSGFWAAASTDSSLIFPRWASVYATLISNLGGPGSAPAADRDQLAGEETARTVVVAGASLQLQAVLAIRSFHIGRVFLEVDLGGVFDVGHRDRRRVFYIESCRRRAPRPIPGQSSRQAGGQTQILDYLAACNVHAPNMQKNQGGVTLEIRPVIGIVQGLAIVHRDRDFRDWVADTVAIIAALSPMLLVW